ncbi:MAG: threonine--tRNA ligase [Clostridia bacterium]|nr:MAG: threonine--tRNA ligase [Clostridia bacterium]
MPEIRVLLPGNEVRTYPAGITLKEIASQIRPGALVAEVNGKIADLNTRLWEDARVNLYTFNEEAGRNALRHSSAHVLAQAVLRLFPGTKLGIGPAISEGFYYDFDPEKAFTPEDLAALEEEMQRIIAADYPFERREVSREEAQALFSERDEIYKVELLNDLPEGTPITIYQQGEFGDLCAGPHLPSTGVIGAVKLTGLAGAYWRGNEANKMLQRIYGTSFPEQEELDAYLDRLEEARKRDHRRLGTMLDLFSLHEEGPGFPFFHPRGMVIRNELEQFWRQEHRRRGYLEIRTPVILQRSLWERSGHWEHYREQMYVTSIDDQEYAIKPMNCPGAILVYTSAQHSYRDFPLRLAELGIVHRHELSGVLHGLMRVRSFTQDDAHIFMVPDKITEEIINVIDLIDYMYGVFGFTYQVELSTRPEKAMGSPEMWDQATQALRQALEVKGIDYRTNEGEGAFYGPKIDFHLRDSLGRTWQCGTIQLDFQLPEKFDLVYTGEDGRKHRPAMLHRVVLGSLERFIGILTEHYGGAFPVWLAPLQVKILPIADRHLPWADEVKAHLEELQVRAEVDRHNEKIGYKIRQAQMEKVPYVLILGDREVAERKVAVRSRVAGDEGAASLSEFAARVAEDIHAKR